MDGGEGSIVMHTDGTVLWTPRLAGKETCLSMSSRLASWLPEDKNGIPFEGIGLGRPS